MVNYGTNIQRNTHNSLEWEGFELKHHQQPNKWNLHSVLIVNSHWSSAI